MVWVNEACFILCILIGIERRGFRRITRDILTNTKLVLCICAIEFTIDGFNRCNIHSKDFTGNVKELWMSSRRNTIGTRKKLKNGNVCTDRLILNEVFKPTEKIFVVKNLGILRIGVSTYDWQIPITMIGIPIRRIDVAIGTTIVGRIIDEIEELAFSFLTKGILLG